MKLHSLKWLLLFGIIATGCENVDPVPVSDVIEKTITNSEPNSSTQQSANKATPGSNTTPSNNPSIPASPDSSTPAIVPATPVTVAPQPVFAAPVQTAQPVQQFVQQQEGQTVHNLNKPLNTVRQYLAYIPAGYNAQPDTKWPIVVFLHGSSELGNDINAIYWTYFAWKTMDKKYPYILITPQLLSGSNEWSAADLDKMLDEILPKYNSDRSRIILTGYSLGAHGAWDWAEYNTNRFAAVLPVSGWGDTHQAYTLKDTPVWAFHGDADNLVNVNKSIDMINAIKKSGGVKANLTVYQGRGHDVHSTTYDNTEVIAWMLNQKNNK